MKKHGVRSGRTPERRRLDFPQRRQIRSELDLEYSATPQSHRFLTARTRDRAKYEAIDSAIDLLS
jgi:hypothetical protein